jgi:hypothetical protein
LQITTGSCGELIVRVPYKYRVKYEPLKEVFPVIGKLMVFDSEFDARRFAYPFGHQHSVFEEIWEAEVTNPHTTDILIDLSGGTCDEENLLQFWTTNCKSWPMSPPLGTLLCDSVRLIRKL